MPNLDLVVPDLQTTLRGALAAVGQDPHHELTYGYRCRINTQRGPTPPPDVEPGTVGHWRHYHLGPLTTQAVLPAWERSFPQDKSPQTWLHAAEQLMARQSREDEHRVMAEEMVSDGWTHCDNVICCHQSLMNDAVVGYAALQVLRIALWDNLYAEASPDIALEEDERDPCNTDCAFSAACAWAGGTKWDEHSSAEIRLAFWRWWLSEAVPAAWLSVTGQ